MAIQTLPASPISSKKRDRLDMTSSSSPASDAADACNPLRDEYERAVAFLREFHARTMPTTLLPANLDSILESDGCVGGGLSLEDALVSDFSLTLSVSSSPGASPVSSSDDLRSAGNGGPIDGPLPSFPDLKAKTHQRSAHQFQGVRVVADVPPPAGLRRRRSALGGLGRRASSGASLSTTARTSRMRRASASGCLSDLGRSSSSSLSSLGEEHSRANESFDSSAIRRPALSPLRRWPSSGLYLGYSLSADLDTEEDRDDVSLPMTKRRRASGEDDEIFF